MSYPETIQKLMDRATAARKWWSMSYPNVETIQAATLKLVVQASALSDQPTPAELDSLATSFDAARRTTRQLAEAQQRGAHEQTKTP